MIAERDRLDSTRADSPLTTPAGSVTVDTTGCTIEEVLHQLEHLVETSEATGHPVSKVDSFLVGTAR
jgi:cytidylate kinase